MVLYFTFVYMNKKNVKDIEIKNYQQNTNEKALKMNKTNKTKVRFRTQFFIL